VPNGHPDYLKGCVDKSLKRLQLERIDLYQLPPRRMPAGSSSRTRSVTGSPSSATRDRVTAARLLLLVPGGPRVDVDAVTARVVGLVDDKRGQRGADPGRQRGAALGLRPASPEVSWLVSPARR